MMMDKTSQPGVYRRPNYHSGRNLPLSPFDPTHQEALSFSNQHHPGQLRNANVVERLRLLRVLNLD